MTLLTPVDETVSRDTLAYLGILEMEKYVPRGEGDPWMACCSNYVDGAIFWCHVCCVGSSEKTCWLCGGTAQVGKPVKTAAR